MKKICGFVLTVLLALGGQVVWADDLSDSNRFLCASVQATICFEDGECLVDLPANLNVPAFVEVDLEAQQLSTTKASGQNRVTPIKHVNREDGDIFLQGFEMGRAFSWVINEQTGQVTVAVAFEGVAVAVFGACTPIAQTTEPGDK